MAKRRKMRLLLDTNIFLEIILEQVNSGKAQELLLNIGDDVFYMSDYSVHSIGILLFRRKKHVLFRQFLQDMVYETGVRIISLAPVDLDEVIKVSQKFNLDFDDAYQYQIAEKFDLTLISFDHDFDRTLRGRKTPNELLE
jgi:uncharacterized protein